MTVQSAAAREAGNGRARVGPYARAKSGKQASPARLTPPPAPGAAAVMIALDKISPSPSNPRKHFDAAKLEELAASIRSHGVLQAVVVRPRPMTRAEAKKAGRLDRDGRPAVNARHDGLYELVVGERRARAARLAGLAEVPARVVEMDDRAVVEVQVIENDQRDDVTPLERADGYGQLVDRHGLTVEDIAAKVGKSATTIRAVLRLRGLPARAKEAMDEPDPAKRLSFSVAELLARQSPAALAAATKYALAPERGFLGRTLPTYRDVRGFIERECQVELKGAPFDRKSLDLVPASGSCDACPKRAGNLAKEDPEGWGAVRADVCTDPACYRAKALAHNERLKAEAKAEGLKVLTAKECAELYPYDHLAFDAPYVDLEATEYEDPKRRTYGELLGGELADRVVLAFDKEGVQHRLAPKAEALKVARKQLPARSRGGRTSAGDAERERRERDAKDGKAAARAANGLVADAARQAAAGLVPGWPEPLTERLRALAKVMPELMWSDACRAVRKRRGLAGGDDRGAIRSLAEGLPAAPDLLALIAELVAARLSFEWGSLWQSGPPEGAEEEFWRDWGIDPEGLRSEARRKREAAPSKGRKAAE